MFDTHATYVYFGANLSVDIIYECSLIALQNASNKSSGLLTGSSFLQGVQDNQVLDEPAQPGDRADERHQLHPVAAPAPHPLRLHLRPPRHAALRRQLQLPRRQTHLQLRHHRTLPPHCVSGNQFNRVY